MLTAYLQSEWIPKMEERLPWHKPEMIQLIVTLDTAFQMESGIDFGYAERAEG